MTKVMEGIRVLEVAQFTFVPAAGAVLADWGADVIKVEHPVRGDAQRGLKSHQRYVLDERRNLLMQHPNRGKRSVGIDLASDDGREMLYALAATCDVFLTNFLPSARRNLRIDVEDIRKHNPNIVYARGSALGDRGGERERGGFDSTAFWARGGSSRLVSPLELDGVLLQPGPGYGDTIGGMNIAGGIAAALLHRERTGKAVELDVSLLSSGVWAAGCSIDIAIELGSVPFRAMMPGGQMVGDNPFVGVFATSDGGHMNLTVLTPGPYIQDTFEHLGLAELARDPRFSTAEKLMENAQAARSHIVDAFKAKTFQYWNERLQTLAGQWGPYQSVLDVGSDSQVLANDMIIEVEADDGGKPIRLVANPVQFDHARVETTRAPEAAEHTEAVLLEIGIGWERLGELKAAGAIA